MPEASFAVQTYNGNLTGDDFTKVPGDKSWMSEMCGFTQILLVPLCISRTTLCIA